MAVEFSPVAEAALTRHQQRHPELETLIREVLAQDPRPAYHKSQQSDREYGVHLHEYNVRWQVVAQCNRVMAIDEISN